jgi:hypothetical protein
MTSTSSVLPPITTQSPTRLDPSCSPSRCPIAALSSRTRASRPGGGGLAYARRSTSARNAAMLCSTSVSVSAGAKWISPW